MESIRESVNMDEKLSNIAEESECPNFIGLCCLTIGTT